MGSEKNFLKKALHYSLRSRKLLIYETIQIIVELPFFSGTISEKNYKYSLRGCCKTYFFGKKSGSALYIEPFEPDFSFLLRELFLTPLH